MIITDDIMWHLSKDITSVPRFDCKILYSLQQNWYSFLIFSFVCRSKYVSVLLTNYLFPNTKGLTYNCWGKVFEPCFLVPILNPFIKEWNGKISDIYEKENFSMIIK